MTGHRKAEDVISSRNYSKGTKKNREERKMEIVNVSNLKKHMAVIMFYVELIS